MNSPSLTTKIPRAAVLAAICLGSASCATQPHPIDRLAVVCDHETLAIDHPSAAVTKTNFRCSKAGFVEK
jgi:hypothetical protein